MSQNLIILQSLKDTAIMRQLSEYINNDFKPFVSTESVSEIQDFFSEVTYSHFPVMDNGIYLGCISAVDAETFETGIRKTVKWYLANQVWVANVIRNKS